MSQNKIEKIELIDCHALANVRGGAAQASAVPGDDPLPRRPGDDPVPHVFRTPQIGFNGAIIGGQRCDVLGTEC